MRIAGVLLVISIAASARAQTVGVVYDRAIGCVPLEGCAPGDTCPTSFPGLDASCDPIPLEDGSTLQVCRPQPSFFCCATIGGLVCPAGAICHLGSTDTSGICLRAENNYCSEDPTIEQVELCHTSTARLFPVDYREGDCDSDGVSNLAEQDSVTDPCRPPPEVVGAWIPADGDIACRGPIQPCESTGAACMDPAFSGTCQRDERTGEGAPLCAPTPDVFCCEGALGAMCPALTCVLASDRPDVPGVCTDPSLLCDTTEASLRACHTSPAGVLVPIEEGDCDADGIDNATERARGSDPCNATADAGPIGGPQPSFAGGGGCRCGIAPGGDRTLFPFAIVVLFFFVRRRS